MVGYMVVIFVKRFVLGIFDFQKLAKRNILNREVILLTILIKNGKI
jgi:hypothetical protein